MKCRNLTTDNTGIFFQCGKPYIKAPLIVDITMYATDATITSKYLSGQIIFNDTDVQTICSKTITLTGVNAIGQNLRFTKGVYTVTINSVGENSIVIKCENQSDAAYGSKLPIRTDLLKYTTNGQVTTIYNDSNKKNGEFTTTSIIPMSRIPAENYVIDAEGTRTSIIQRLSIIKGELWYSKQYGLPLLDKLKSKGMFDAFVLKTISEHPDVVEVQQFDSNVDNHVYNCSFKILTKYGQLSIETSL